MALNLTEFISEINEHHGNRTDLTDSKIIRALNLSQDRIARSYDFEELQNAVSGTFTITDDKTVDKFLAFSAIAGNFDPRNIYSFRVVPADGTDIKLGRSTPRRFDELVPRPEWWARGRPSYYIKWQNKFEFWKIPDTADPYEIRYTNWPTAFASAQPTAVSDLIRKDDMLIHLTVSYLYNSLSEYEKAGRFFGYFQSEWQEAVAADSERPDRVIRGDSMSPQMPAKEYWLNPFQASVRT